MTDDEARWSRVERLRGLQSLGLHTKVTDALQAEWQGARQPKRIRIRRGYARRQEPLEGPYSDRKLPPRDLRPPATRLLSANGSALEMHLTCLFVAQATTAPGKAPGRTRLVLPRSSDNSGLTPWADLVAAPATLRKTTGRLTWVTVEDNRVRQLAGTLGRLASGEVGLLDFPRATEVKGRFEHFRMLDETGRLDRASKVAYVVPTVGEDLFALPVEFFTRGWHIALSDSEIAMLLALSACRCEITPWPSDGVVAIDGASRIRRYGLSPDAYATHKLLEKFGVLEVLPAEGRREDGTFDKFGAGNEPIPHRLRVIEDGFKKEAVSTVMATLKGLGVRKPDTA